MPNSPIYTEALWWYDNGFRVSCDKPNSKSPTKTGWKYNEYNSKEHLWAEFAKNGGHNLAIITGDGLVCVDIDSIDGNTSIKPLEFLPPTTCISGRKSKPASHLYYRCHANECGITQSWIGPTRLASQKSQCYVELLSRWHNNTPFKVTIPPSTWNGETYEWSGPRELPPLVPWEVLSKGVEAFAKARWPDARLFQWPVKPPDVTSCICGNELFVWLIKHNAAIKQLCLMHAKALLAANGDAANDAASSGGPSGYSNDRGRHVNIHELTQHYGLTIENAVQVLLEINPYADSMELLKVLDNAKRSVFSKRQFCKELFNNGFKREINKARKASTVMLEWNDMRDVVVYDDDEIEYGDSDIGDSDSVDELGLTEDQRELLETLLFDMDEITNGCESESK